MEIDRNLQTFENQNKAWKKYAIAGIYLTILYFFLIFINAPVGDYNHFFLFVSLWTSILWAIEKFKWQKENSYREHFLKRRPWWIEWTSDIFPLVLIFFLFRGFIYEPFKIPSGSMEPTLYSGDIVLVNKFIYGIKSPVSKHKLINVENVKRGDIIVFKYPPNPQEYYIKRAVGMPGDKLEYVFQDKKLIINNKEIIHSQDMIENLEGKLHKIQLMQDNGQLNIPTFEGFLNKDSCLFNLKKMVCNIPQGYYFAMGDNRDNSLDSRFWGFVPLENIVGTPDFAFNIFSYKFQTF